MDLFTLATDNATSTALTRHGYSPRQGLVQALKTGTGTAMLRVRDRWNTAILWEYAFGAGAQAVTAPFWIPHEYYGELVDVVGDVAVTARVDGGPAR